MPDELKQNSMPEFIWDVVVGGFDAKETVQVRFDSALPQGVPLP